MDRLAQETLAEVCSGIGAAPFLIVRLDEFSNTLADALVAADADVKRKNQRALSSTLQVMLSPMMNEPPPLTGPGRAGATIPAGRIDDREAARPNVFVAPELFDAKCYVVRLSNRTTLRGGKLSIGRDASHDIVLNHPSVSATHAYLTLEPIWGIRDAGSRNGTFLNGAALAPSAPVRSGDRLKFGAVQTVLCGAADLWRALR